MQRSPLSLFAWPFLLVGIAVAQSPCPDGWIASQSIAGKCYRVLSGITINELYYGIVSACVNAGNGAGDLLAIANAFENTEVASLLKNQSISSSLIGVVLANSTPYWLSAHGYTSYSTPLVLERPNCNFYALSVIDRLWWCDEDWEFVLCQMYPNNASMRRPPMADCPPNFTPSITVPGKCYKIGSSSGAVTFSQAGNFCASQQPQTEIVALSGGYLEALEVGWFGDSGSSGYQWINYVRNGSQFQWGGSHPPTNFTPQIATDTGDCAIVCGTFYVCSVDCNSYVSTDQMKLRALCEYYTDAVVTTTTTAATATTTTTTTTITTTTVATRTSAQYPTTSISQSGCPNDWIQSSRDPTKCYSVIEQTVDFETAQNLCLILHHEPAGELVALTGKDEIEDLYADTHISVGVTYWVGLETFDGSHWQWISPGGDTITWAPGQPDTATNPTHRCGALNQSAIYAETCTDTYKVICQMIMS